MGCCHVTEGTLEEPASFDLKSVTEGDEKPDIQSPVFIIEDGTMRIHFNQKAEEYKAPDSPLNRAFTEFVGAFYPLLHGDSIRQQRLDSLMRSELSRHNDDILGSDHGDRSLIFSENNQRPVPVISLPDPKRYHLRAV